jgi:hypothetical protein
MTLLEEDNSTSLRTVLVDDDGDLVDLRLMPSLPDQITKRVKPGWGSSDYAWLYRHMRSPLEEWKLMHALPCMKQDVRPMEFGKDPEFQLLWTSSGNSVALFLNGEPWAFICEETHQGYSKGILNSGVGNLWNQELFNKTFNVTICKR